MNNNDDSQLNQIVLKMQQEMATKKDIDDLGKSIERMFQRYAGFGNPNVSNLPKLIKNAFGSKNISDETKK